MGPAFTAGPAHAQDGSLPGLNALGGCVQKNHQLAALLLIDESASLRSTDPNDQRVVAAKTALQTLAGLGEQNGGTGAPRVDVAVAAFGVDFHMADGWRQLTYANLNQAKAAVDPFANRESDIDTDYYAAVLGAKAELAQHVATMDAASPPCRALIWFTDGKYDIASDRKSQTRNKSYAPDITLGSKEASQHLLERGKDLLCKADGLADQLRGDSAVTVAVALSGGIAKQDQDFLQAIATGSGGSATCGAKGTDRSGAYIAANDLGTLVAAFDGIANVIGYGTQGPPRLGLPICVGAPCGEGRFDFPVDPGMTRFHVLVKTGTPGASIQVKSAEGGTETNLQVSTESERAIGSVQLRYAWVAPDVMTVDGFLPVADVAKWSGTWSITVLAASPPPAGTTAGTRLFYYGDVHARLDGTPTLSASEDTTLNFRVGYGQSNLTLPPELLDRAVANMAVTATAGSSPAVTAKAGERKGELVPVVIPKAASWADSPVELSVKTAFTTRSGITLRPLEDTFTLQRPAVVAAGSKRAPKNSAAKKANEQGFPVRLTLVGLGALGLIALVTLLTVWLLRRRRSGSVGAPIPGLNQVRVGRYRLRVRYGRSVGLSFLDEYGRGLPFRVSPDMIRETIVGSARGVSARVGAIVLERQGDRVVATHPVMRIVSSLNAHGRLEQGGHIAFLPVDLHQGWVFVGASGESGESGAPYAITAVQGDPDQHPRSPSPRTVNIADAGRGDGGHADGQLDGEIYLFSSPNADLRQIEQSAVVLLPALVQAIASSTGA